MNRLGCGQGPPRVLVVSLLLFLARGSEAQVYPRQYQLWTSEEIKYRLTQWSNEYPDLIRVTTSQEKYGLQSAGRSSDCPFDGSLVGCLNYFAVLQDRIAHPEGSASSKRLPAVLLSGSLHGDERVGPAAVMETVDLLLQATACEGLPPSRGATVAEIQTAQQCRQDLRQQGISDNQRRWLARLVTTRRIVVVPTANALGFYRYTREEGSIDANRDFAYDILNPTECMQTIAARTLNEIFRDDMFQLCFTFHGGIELLGYEWGAESYRILGVAKSPDDEAQKQLATAFSWYGGGWNGHPPYETGPMNNIIYAVRGGMEDWAYAASWDGARANQCTPTTYGGYPTEKTIYNDSTLRAFNMLVEASNNKTPASSDLGTSLNVLDSSTTGNGHLSRNIRLSVAAIDMVEPYLYMVSVDDLDLTDDIVPLVRRSCDSLQTVAIPQYSNQVRISWTIGGSMEIDETRVWVADAFLINSEILQDCLSQPSSEDIRSVFVGGTAQSGSGFFSPNGPQPAGLSSLGPVFSNEIDVSNLGDGDELLIIASARVDSSWATQSGIFTPNVTPQAHLVNARTNANWYHENAGKIVEGRLDWFSRPIRLIRGTSTETLQLDSRFDQGPPVPTPAPVRFVTKRPTRPPSSAIMSKLNQNHGGAGGSALRRRRRRIRGLGEVKN